jgi:hypothetical protein
MQPEAGAHLWDAVEAARLVHEFTRTKTMADSTSDILLRSAIERCGGVIRGMIVA